MHDLRSDEGLVLRIDGASARTLRLHLPHMIPASPRFGVWNAFNMVRYRSFHKVFFVAIGLGLGVSMESPEEDALVIRMNRTVGERPVPADTVIVRTAKDQTHQRP